MTLTHPRSAVAVLAIVGISTSLLLGGCSLIPKIPVLNPGGSSQEDSDSNSDSNSDVDDALENPYLNHEVPETFPSDVPLPDLPILLSLDLDAGWTIVYSTDDVEGDYEDAVAELEAAGFDTIMSNSADGASFGALENEDYSIQVNAATDNTGYDSAILSFTVVKKN
jgi:hypothetical protein